MKYIIVFFILITTSYSFATDKTFDSFNTILDKYVKETNLSGGGYETAFLYEKLKTDKKDLAHIQKQKEILKNFSVATLKDKNTANAFWINAYNFFMIAVIMDKGFEGNKLKINSVKDFGSFFNPYKIFQKKIFQIGKKKYSLDQIEKETLLGKDFKKNGWKDARIHFAVNCASVGCPPLLPRIYQKETLDKTLDDNIKKALKTKRHYHIKGDTLYVTHLFKWYKSDFEEHLGGVKEFLANYLENANPMRKTSDIDYIDYNWDLNKPGNF